MERLGPMEQPSDRGKQPQLQPQPQPQGQEHYQEQEYQQGHQRQGYEQQETSKSPEEALSMSPDAPAMSPDVPAVSPRGSSGHGQYRDRRLSEEWDAAKVPPSRFQKRKGSIFATPSTRDGHINTNTADKYYAKVAEMKCRRLSAFDPTNPSATK